MALTPNAARERAEEWMQTLQKQARAFLDAEEGMVKTLRDFVEQGLAPAEVKKNLEEIVGRIKANRLWEGLRAREAVTFIADTRDEVERRVDEIVHRLLTSLQIVTTADVAELDAKMKTIAQRIDQLEQRKTHKKKDEKDAN